MHEEGNCYEPDFADDDPRLLLLHEARPRAQRTGSAQAPAASSRGRS